MKILDRCGRYLSSIVYNNIALLIALGILRILFGPKGWFPHEEFFALVHPMMMYLIPIIFAFTGGKFIGEFRGGLAAAFVTMAVITGSDQEYPMILAALLIGPMMGYLVKKTDHWLANRIPVGFELLVHNVVSAVLSVLMAALCYIYVAPIMSFLINGIMLEMQVLISSGLLPLLAIIIEPGKVLFFNNVMNHGILEPLGISQLHHDDTSIFFMLESNPGPGFGVLLALFLWKRRKERADIKAAMTIQFLGGIHEVYFPYVLSRPMLILPLILGGLTGNFLFTYFQAGLVATPSPGSILVYLAMAPRHTMLGVMIGFCSSIVISLGTAYLLLWWRDKNKKSHASAEMENAKDNSRALTTFAVESTATTSKKIQNVVFACDGGLASSAMGAAKLKKLLAQYENNQITVSFCAVDRIPASADLVVLQEYLRDRLVKSTGEVTYLFVPSLVEPFVYDQVLQLIFENHGINNNETAQPPLGPEEIEGISDKLPIALDIEAANQEEAIALISKRLYKWNMISQRCFDAVMSMEKSPMIMVKHSIAFISDWDTDENPALKQGIAIVRFNDNIMLNCGEETRIFILICGDIETRMTLVPHVAHIIEEEEIRQRLLVSDSEALQEILLVEQESY